MKTCRKRLHLYPKELPRCPECRNNSNKQWYKENLTHRKKYYETNKEYYQKKSKVKYETNKKQIILNIKNKYKTNLLFKMSHKLRARFKQALKKNFKSGSAVRDLGCSIEELKPYLESKFYPNPETGEIMSWDNYGLKGWHIDHIKPLYSFDLSDPEQVKKACHYSNLQPLWAKENLSKNKF